MLPKTPAPRAPGDMLQDAFREHYAFVCQRLHGLGVAPSQVDDAAQDVFEVLVRRIGDFDPAFCVRRWMAGIARRVARRYRDRAHRSLRLIADSDAANQSPDDNPEDLARIQEAREVLRTFLRSLDRPHWEVFVLSEIEGLRGSEIAAELGLNQNTVYTRLRSARRDFARALARHHAKENRPRWGAWLPLWATQPRSSPLIGVAAAAAVGVLLLGVCQLDERPGSSGSQEAASEAPLPPDPPQPSAVSGSAATLFCPDRLEVQALEDEIAVLEAQLELHGEGIGEDHVRTYGTPLKWSDAPLRFQPEAFRGVVDETLETCAPEVELRGMDCHEPPCIALLRVPQPQWQSSKLTTCPSWNEQYGSAETVSASTIDCDDGRQERVHQLSAPRMFEPNTAEFDNLLKRLSFRWNSHQEAWVCAGDSETELRAPHWGESPESSIPPTPLEQGGGCNDQRTRGLRQRTEDLHEQLRFSTRLAEAADRERHGKPLAWDGDVAPALLPEQFRDRFTRVVEECAPRFELVSFECDEPPCIALLRDPRSSDRGTLTACPHWRDAYGPSQSGFAGEVECDDGRREAIVLVSPNHEGAHPERLAKRLRFRWSLIRDSWECRSTLSEGV